MLPALLTELVVDGGIPRSDAAFTECPIAEAILAKGGTTSPLWDLERLAADPALVPCHLDG